MNQKQMARQYARRALAQNCEQRGFVCVDEGVWAYARRDGSVVITHREPTTEERHAVIEPASVDLNPAPMPKPTRSAASRRVASFFGTER